MFESAQPEIAWVVARKHPNARTLRGHGAIAGSLLGRLRRGRDYPPTGKPSSTDPNHVFPANDTSHTWPLDPYHRTMARPISETPDAFDVYHAFGATMGMVQGFERSLAALVLLFGPSPRTRQLKNAEAVTAVLERTFARSMRAYQRASASELRKKLPEGFDPELMAEIESLTEWRDRLAHSYLIEKLNLGEGPNRFQLGTADELVRVGIAFRAAWSRLNEEIRAEIEALPGTDVPDWLRQFLASLAGPIVFGEQRTPPA